MARQSNGTPMGDSLSEMVAGAIARLEGNDHDNLVAKRLTAEAIAKQVEYVEGLHEQHSAVTLYGKTFLMDEGFGVSHGVSPMALRLLNEAGSVMLGWGTTEPMSRGLTGTHRKLGICPGIFNAETIAGGPSTGCAAAVGLGVVDFAIGSGRSGASAAGYSGVVCYAPSHGLISRHGMKGGSAVLDRALVFAKDLSTAQKVSELLAVFDQEDPYARKLADFPAYQPRTLRIGIPEDRFLTRFGDVHSEFAFQEAFERACTCGVGLKTIDFSPFEKTAGILRDGPWSESYLQADEEVGQFSASDVFRFDRTLMELRRAYRAGWEEIDLLLVPSAGRVYSMAETLANEEKVDRELGYYTDHASLLDLCAMSLPGGIRSDGLPVGATLFAPAGGDEFLFWASGRLKFSARGK